MFGQTLRKYAATTLAEAGCSAHEIASITGHLSIAMVQHYTKSADQKRLAEAAIRKLQTAKRKPPNANRCKPICKSLIISHSS
ncbi:tyrosine-type recombinase/integrase [Komagataeibacter sp. FNDCR1]|nr:tyrosine-type recombinase/integrase [Komagataeibacter sp. FNDCR1]